jgi:hypothetical protein
MLTRRDARLLGVVGGAAQLYVMSLDVSLFSGNRYLCARGSFIAYRANGRLP